MSENCRFYAEKMVARRARLAETVEVRRQMTELLRVVQRCEAMWALEERVEKCR